MLASELFENKICPVCGCTPCNCTHIVKEDSVNEVSQDWNEQWRAGQQLADLFNKKMKKGNFTAQDLELAKSLVKITGRAHNIGRSGYRKYTAGNILDDIVNIVRDRDIAAGKTPEIGRAPTTREMAKQIAAITKGRTAWRNPTTWSTNFGDRYRDAADHVEYDDEAAYHAAWKLLSSKGKQVHYKEGGGLHTAIQIGSFLIEPSSRTMGYFSDNPETTHSISVRTVKSLGGRRQKQDISDEQAAKLQQIARDKNNAMLDLVKAIFKAIGEKDAAKIITNSEKLSPAEKTKLGKIVAKGQQGVAEGTCAKHISPSGAETTMCPDDEDYEINYGKDSGIDDFRKKNGLDVRTGKKVREDSDPCWSGYKQIGTKDKAGKKVPNCVPEGTDIVPAANPEDTVSLDIPLLIRLLEYAREDAKTDMDLHDVAERLITMSADGKTLSMNDYGTIIPNQP